MKVEMRHGCYSRAGNTAAREPVSRSWAAAPRERSPPKGTPECQNIDARWKEPHGDRLNVAVFNAWKPGEKRDCKMGFIGRDIPKDVLLGGLAQCVAARVRAMSMTDCSSQFPGAALGRKE
jgi:hypothetical protein